MIYHLEVEARFCKVDALINGFPGYDLNGNNPAIFSKPINAFLIGNNNLMSFIITRAEQLDDNEKYSIRGSVKKYLSNQMTGPDQGEIITTFFYENQPVASVSFNNEIYNYSSLFKESKKVENRTNLLDYAEKLKTLLLQRNIALIINEFDPKLRDYAIAYSVEKEILIQQLTDYLQNDYFANNPMLDISRDEIFLRPWCDGRIWEIGISPKFLEFLLTEPNDEGMMYVTRLFVALVNDTLKVIR